MTPRTHRLFHTVLPLLALLFVTQSCRNIAPAVSRDEMAFRRAPSELTLIPGDEVEVKFVYNPELNEIQLIRPDGKISLQLIGEVTAKGKTPAELEKELKQLYENQLKNPAVNIVLRSLYQRRIYVGGQVNEPGVVDMPGSLTALEAVMLAGGFERWTGSKQQVIVIRNIDGKRMGCSLNLDRALSGREQDPFYLEPTDIVFVPQTRIANVNQWVEQHINRMLPRIAIWAP